MKWVLLANTGNYPAANYVNMAMIFVTLSIAIVGLVGIIRGSREPGDDGEKQVFHLGNLEVDGDRGLRYIDVLKRTREYFKAPGVFRLLKRQWNYLYPKKEADGQ